MKNTSFIVEGTLPTTITRTLAQAMNMGNNKQLKCIADLPTGKIQYQVQTPGVLDTYDALGDAVAKYNSIGADF